MRYGERIAGATLAAATVLGAGGCSGYPDTVEKDVPCQVFTHDKETDINKTIHPSEYVLGQVAVGWTEDVPGTGEFAYYESQSEIIEKEDGEYYLQVNGINNKNLVEVARYYRGSSGQIFRETAVQDAAVVISSDEMGKFYVTGGCLELGKAEGLEEFDNTVTTITLPTTEG